MRKFSIMIPSWDDYRYLKPCLDSIKKYSAVEHEILLHLNTYNDDLVKLAGQYDPNFTKSEKNEGIAYGYNVLVTRATTDWFFMVNSDNIFLPGWDIALDKAVDQYGTNALYSSVMIEPQGNNYKFIIKDYGLEPEVFRLEELVKDVPSLQKDEIIKCHNWPCLFPRDLFDGFDERMWPGWVCDDDISVAAYAINPDMQFLQVKGSLLYHFMCKCTHKIGTPEERWNLGLQAKKIFDEKWSKIFPGMNCDNYRSIIGQE